MVGQHKTNHSDPTTDNCYHWANSMNGGKPDEERDLRLPAVFVGGCFLVLLISWTAYQVVQ